MKMKMKIRFFALILVFGVSFFVFPLFVQAALDTDGDGLSDSDEKTLYFTNPNNPDTDEDGFFDMEELKYDYSPHQKDARRLNENDYDADGLNDWVELRWFGSSLGSVDSDSDAVSDFDEVMKGSKPQVSGTSTVYKREIVVDRTIQQLFYYVDGIKVKTFPVSTGNPQTPTPAGNFTILKKLPFVDYIGVDYSYPHTPWNMRFKQGYYIHTAYWHNDFGKRTRSHGCINMRKEDAELLYKYVDINMPVTVTGTTPVGRYVK